MQINLSSKACSIMGLVCMVMLLQGCSDKTDLYVVMSSGNDGRFLELVPYEYLSLDLDAGKLLDIYEEYDDKYKGSMSQDELISLMLEREKSLQSEVFTEFGMTRILNYGLPVRVFKSEMSELDEALYKTEQTYYESYNLTPADLEEADKKVK